MEKLVLIVLLVWVVSWIIVLVDFMRFSKSKDGIRSVEALKLTPVFVCVMFGSIFTALMAVIML